MDAVHLPPVKNQPPRRSVQLSNRPCPLDRLDLGARLTHIPWGAAQKPIPLPPSKLHLPKK